MGETRVETEPSAPRGEATPERGRRIGPYQLDRLLGRGGMGEVYLAVRTDDFEKRVALKLIRRGADSARVEAHFRAERQILAHLEHPSIARVLDGGTTEDGRPYLVMEYVEGEPLDRYCRTHKLSVRRRLLLFRQVCAAVAAAHSQLVVHRDLKPSNIQVSAGGAVKLLDFGLAKLLDPDPAVVDAASGERSPMTPAWASPEQLTGDPITTLSDVYSLGTVLYQLLAGRLPFSSEKSGWAVVLQICSAEAPPPSVAAGGDRELAGDLDAIVHQAMRKRPEDRYGSVEQLSEDLRRYLVGLPVEARQGGWAYHGGRFIRRNKLAVAMLLLVLGVGVATSTLWWRAERERAEAVRQRGRAESVSRFLEQIFDGAPVSGRDSTLSVRELLDRGRQRLTRDLEALPAVRAELAGTLGNVYTDLGLYEEGRELLAEAVRSRRAHRGEHAELAVDVNNLGRLLYRAGDHDAAESFFRQALAIRLRLGQGDAEVAVARANLASILSYRGAYEEAESHYRQLLAFRERTYGREDSRVASILYSLGSLHFRSGDPEAAEPLLRRALAIRRQTYGAHDTRVATVEGTPGRVLFERGDSAGARRRFEEALAVRRNLLGDEHPHVAVTRRDLAMLLLADGDVAAAGEALAAALAVLRRTRSAGDVALASTESVYGAWLVALGRYQEAEPYLVESLRILRKVQGERSIYTRDAGRRVDELYRVWGRSRPK